MFLAASTIRAMHRIAQEENPSFGRISMLALRAQTVFDWSLWVRRVDVALIGGDPVILSRRICGLLEAAGQGPVPRIAILHPRSFSGAPLAVLEDPVFRGKAGLVSPFGISDAEAPGAIVDREAGAALRALAGTGRYGVFAFDLVQGTFDAERNEVVLRLTRDHGKPRQTGLSLSGRGVSQISASADGTGSDVYRRSERLFHLGMDRLGSGLAEIMDTPPRGRRFADLVIARKCEVLSGFVSPPGGGEGGFDPVEMSLIEGSPYRLAGRPPQTVNDAITFWLEDFRRASGDPIFLKEEEFKS